MNLKNSQTSIFLRLIGLPHQNKPLYTEGIDRQAFYTFAKKNRIRLFYLNSLAEHEQLFNLEHERIILLERYAKISQAFIKIANLLKSFNVNYAFFKSIRPYTEVTVDIDILTFGSEYMRVLGFLENAGYLRLGEGPLSTTYRDIDAKINLDIYEDVGISHFVYMDKNKLSGSICEVNLADGCIGHSFCPEADLLAVIAHSIIKEHMYVLSEYFTTMYYLRRLTRQKLFSFVSLANRCRLRSTVKTHLGITGLLHYYAHGFIPGKITELLGTLGGSNSLELYNLVRNNLKVPHKYHLKTMTTAFFELFKESKTRRSIASQISSMFNPEFSASFIKMALEHVFRETY